MSTASNLELLFAERRTIAEGEYRYRAGWWTKALLGSYEGDNFLILLGGVWHTLDDDSGLSEWIPERPPVIARPRTRHAAIRVAVEDADTWGRYVNSKLPSFPRGLEKTERP